MENRLDVADLALQLIEDYRSSGPAVARFLLALRERLPATSWRTMTRTMRALNESQSRRTSRLGEHQVWSKLGLPQDLYDLLADQVAVH